MRAGLETDLDARRRARADGPRSAGTALTDAEVAAVAEAALEELPAAGAGSCSATCRSSSPSSRPKSDVEAGLDPRALGLFSGTGLSPTARTWAGSRG